MHVPIHPSPFGFDIRKHCCERVVIQSLQKKPQKTAPSLTLADLPLLWSSLNIFILRFTLVTSRLQWLVSFTAKGPKCFSKILPPSQNCRYLKQVTVIYRLGQKDLEPLNRVRYHVSLIFFEKTF